MAGTLAVLLALQGAASASLIFFENFNYTVGSNLAGQNGGTGFSGAWSGGTSTIVSGLGGTGNAVQIASSPSTRSLSATYNTAGNTYYMSFLMRASDFHGGNYTGFSLYNGGSEQFFVGIPWQQYNFGFDAHGGLGVADLKVIDFSAADNVTYLLTVGLLPSATAGKTDIKLWATSDLSVDPNTLVSSAPNASQIGLRNTFSFSSVRVAGDYSSNVLKFTGVASAPTAAESINATVNSAPVPEPGTWAMAALLLGGAGFARWRKRMV